MLLRWNQQGEEKPDEAVNSSFLISKSDDEKLVLTVWITSEENETSKILYLTRTRTHAQSLKKQQQILTLTLP
jgi:superfamily II DNA/RNA helicase